jgi:hypothetical protein
VDTIIGLGSAGCNIADEFAKYSQYEVFKIDVGLRGERSFNFPERAGHEEYEQSCPSMKEFFKDVSGEVLFIVSGSGYIAGATLRVLYQIRHCKIYVLYIQPDVELLSNMRRMQERVTCGVLQEYARSAVLEKIYLISNCELENILGDVPVVEYNDKLNELIVSTIHMYNVFRNNKSIDTTFAPLLPSARIATFGIFDVDKGEEKMFFPLDIVREKRYYYGINEQTLKTDGQLFKKIKDRTKEQNKEMAKASYSIFSTDYEQNYGYIICHTSKIQLDTLRNNEYNK